MPAFPSRLSVVSRSTASAIVLCGFLVVVSLGISLGCSADNPSPASEPPPSASPEVAVASKKNVKHDWALYRGDPRSSGVALGQLPDELVLRWKFTVEKGAFEGTAAIVDGVVYIGDLDGAVYALSLKTGAKLWEYKVDSGFIAAPAVRDGMVYIGDYDGRFYCLTAKDGHLKWGFDTNAEIDASANF